MVDVKIKRGFRKNRYIGVYVFTLMIFITGVFVGWMFSSFLLLKYQETQELLRAQLIGMDMRGDLLEEGEICNFTLERMFEDKSELGATITQLEDKKGKEDSEVLLIKEFYQLVELETFLMAEDFNEQCDANLTLVLFFYTNEEEGLGDERSEDLGYILSNLFTRYLSFEVFAFDDITDNPALNALREKYEIEEYPSVVINGELYPGYYSSYQIEQMLELV